VFEFAANSEKKIKKDLTFYWVYGMLLSAIILYSLLKYWITSLRNQKNKRSREFGITTGGS